MESACGIFGNGAGSMFLLSVTDYPVFGATPPAKSCVYALAKNAILWHFCLRFALTLKP